MDNEASFISSLKFKDHASWAVWGSTVDDLSIFKLENKPWKYINNKVVLVGLNASNPVENFNNFHFVKAMKKGRAYDVRLKMLLENTPFYGAYLTDLVVFDNDYNPKSKEVGITERHINDFLNEINSVCENPIIIAMGNDVYKALKQHNINCYFIKHFCYQYCSDETYIKETSKQLKDIADKVSE